MKSRRSLTSRLPRTGSLVHGPRVSPIRLGQLASLCQRPWRSRASRRSSARDTRPAHAAAAPRPSTGADDDNQDALWILYPAYFRTGANPTTSMACQSSPRTVRPPPPPLHCCKLRFLLCWRILHLSPLPLFIVSFLQVSPAA